MPAMKHAMNEGMKLDTRYEGGGIPRMIAAVYLNSRVKPLGLYRPEEGLELLKTALASPSIADPSYPEPITGVDAIENYYHYAEGLWKNDLQQEAVDLLVQTLEEYNELAELNELFAGREPETHYYATKIEVRLQLYRDELADEEQ